MGLLYKICMVIVKQPFTKMPNGSTAQQAAALESFMARPTNPKSTGSPREAIDKLSKSSTGHETGPFVPQCVGPFWKPPQKAPEKVQVDDVPPPTLAQRVQSRVSSLMRNQVSTNTFAAGLTQLGFPIFVIFNLLTKMGLVCEKNGNQMVQRTNLSAFVKALVLMKERVDFFLAVIEKLHLGSIGWNTLLNPNNPNYVETSLSKDEIKKILRLLTNLRFNSGLDSVLSLPASWRSFSMSECSNQVWTAVSQWDWDLPLPAKKRCRKDDNLHPANEDKKRMFSPEELISTVLSKLTRSLLATHGLGELSLFDFFWTAFLDMSPEHLRQMMEFLSNEDNKWRLQRILMEVPRLNVVFRNGDFYLSMGDKFTFLSFNLDEMLKHFNGLFLEAIMMRQMAGQELHEQEVREAQERQRVERFRTAIWNLWKNKDKNDFFRELVAVCPDFNSFSTNWSLLAVVVDEFMQRIYNSTTRAYHNREPCENPLQEFLEYATVRGVFSPKAPVCESTRICEYSLKSCPYGPTCSGVHQCVVSSGWKTGSVWGTCCSEYSERRTCSNRHCRYAHFTGDEFNRALRNGGKDSNKMREDLIKQAENQLKRQKTAE